MQTENQKGNIGTEPKHILKQNDLKVIYRTFHPRAV